MRIALDGDAVVFDESSEVRYKQEGLEAFHEYEALHEDEALGEGPYAGFLRKLIQLQDRLPTRIEFAAAR